MNSLFIGVHRQPFARELFGVADDLFELLSDSGSRQPAMRTATNAAPPIRTAATITPSATSSSARTAPIELKPCPTTITTSPSDIAISAATPTRRSWLEAPDGDGRDIDHPYLSVRATSRASAFVPSFWMSRRQTRCEAMLGMVETEPVRWRQVAR